MRRRGFQDLLAELAGVVGVLDLRAAPGAGLCRCGAFDVAIYHDERADPRHLHVYIDVGPVPVARQREVFRSLLLRHLQLVPPHRTVVGLDDASGNIVVVARIPFVATLSGARLAALLQQLIRQVLIWRTPVPTGRLAGTRTRHRPRPS